MVNYRRQVEELAPGMVAAAERYIYLAWRSAWVQGPARRDVRKDQ